MKLYKVIGRKVLKTAVAISNGKIKYKTIRRTKSGYYRAFSKKEAKWLFLKEHFEYCHKVEVVLHGANPEVK